MSPPRTMSAPYTLLIDSDTRFADDLETILGGAGICLKLATNSAEAKLLVKDQLPELILIDLERPARESLRLLNDLEKLSESMTPRREPAKSRRELEKRQHAIPYAWISSLVDDEIVRRVKSTNALGLIDRYADTVSMVCAMRAILTGDRYFPPQHTNPATPSAKAEAESRRIIKLLHSYADHSEG